MGSAASLDVLTGGRVEPGVGSGGFPDAVAGMGGDAVRGGQAVTVTAEGCGRQHDGPGASVLDAPGPCRPVRTRG